MKILEAIDRCIAKRDLNLSEMVEVRDAVADLIEKSTQYARLIQVDNFDRNDIAVHRAYEELRAALARVGGAA